MTYKIFNERNEEVATITCASLYEIEPDTNKFYVRTGDDGSFVGTLSLNQGCRAEIYK